MTVELHLGRLEDVLPTLTENSFDTCITDPPYHLKSIVKRFGKSGSAPAQFGADGRYSRVSKGFMGKEWDGGDVAFRKETWEAVYRVLKPGALLLAFGGTRTYHRLTCAIEDAGFDIRDCIFWIYGSGFPKSHDISKGMDKAAGVERTEFYKKPIAYPDSDTWGIPNHHSKGNNIGFDTRGQGDRGDMDGHGNQIKSLPSTDLARLWDGWGTALKPACEPIVVAMKPLDGTFAQNAEKWGVAGMNVDGGRIAGEYKWRASDSKPSNNGTSFQSGSFGEGPNAKGRWPANVILDEDSAEVMDEQSGVSSSNQGKPRGTSKKGLFANSEFNKVGTEHTDSGGASRFFYVAKASRKEREMGLEGMPLKGRAQRYGLDAGGSLPQQTPHKHDPTQNNHPTVKPLALMRYLCKLTATPTGGIVLDPFCGSGTTGMAAVMENRSFVGIEKEADYKAIAEKRIAEAQLQTRMAI